MTNHWIDLRNSDCLLIQGSNCAENHPIAFKWIMKAKESGAKLIHVDPRFTRTSAKADFYAPLRSGTDVAFLGGMIKYIIENEKYFKEYVVNYTNASFLVNDKFDFDDGLFSGYDTAGRKYDKATWTIKKDDKGIPLKDPSLMDPRCVFQLLKKHYSRYDLNTVSSITGTPVKDLQTVYEMFSSTGVPDKAGTMLYALGQTQHTGGVQNIRTMCMVQLLLGNIGICGGGINALRGEPNVQGSTDHAILSHILPGYLKAPRASQQTLDDYMKINTPKTSDPRSANWWQNYPKYTVSLLKAWYGDKATKENEFGYAWVPKLDDGQDCTLLNMVDNMYEKKIKGLIVFAQNPACSLPNAVKVREGLSNLDWMVHLNIFNNETASFWKGPGLDPKKVKTEVFLLPAAASVEKQGSQTNSGRMVMWKYEAAKGPGDAKYYAGDAVIQIVAKLQELYKKDKKGVAPDPILNLKWDYADDKGRFDVVKAAKTINGYFLEDVPIGDKTYKKGDCVPSFAMLQADGKTSSGNWLMSGSFAQDGANLMTRRKKDDPTGLGLYPQWAWAWPVNRRIIYNRASVDLNGKPYNPKRPLLAWVDGKWVGDVPDGPWPPMADMEKGKYPFIMKPDGFSALFGPGLSDGPFPEHYEPLEGPLSKNPLSSQLRNPAIKIFSGPCDLYSGCDPKWPFVMTTYSSTEHWCSGANTRWQSWLTEAQPQVYVEISEELAQLRGIKNGDKVKVESARGSLPCVAMVTTRIRPFNCGGQTIHLVGMTYNYGWLFPENAGDSANLLSPTAGDANTMTPEYKAFMVNVTKV
jgi:formate dehydrogenase major subunit